MLPLLFLISSIGLGLSAVILVSLIAEWVFDWKVSTRVLEGLAKGSVGVWALFLALKLVHLIFSGLIGRLFSFGIVGFWFMVEVTLMLIIPIVLFSIPSLRSQRWVLFVGSASATIGTTLNRFNLTFTAQSVGGIWTMQRLADSATYFPSWMEIVIQAGAIALAALGWYLAIRYLPILPRKRRQAQTASD